MIIFFKVENAFQLRFSQYGEGLHVQLMTINVHQSFIVQAGLSMYIINFILTITLCCTCNDAPDLQIKQAEEGYATIHHVYTTKNCTWNLNSDPWTSKAGLTQF